MPLTGPAVSMPDRDPPQSEEQTELVALRRSLQAAQSEIRIAKRDAEAAKRALKEAENSLHRIEDPDPAFLQKIAARALNKLFTRIARAARHSFNLWHRTGNQTNSFRQ